ncbi:MAG TPA: pectinesterase family protein [Polyangiaceae bacterium]
MARIPLHGISRPAAVVLGRLAFIAAAACSGSETPAPGAGAGGSAEPGAAGAVQMAGGKTSIAGAAYAAGTLNSAGASIAGAGAPAGNGAGGGGGTLGTAGSNALGGTLAAGNAAGGARAPSAGNGGGNAAGSDGSGGTPASLPKGVSALFPAPGARGVCPDPPLRLSFAGVPSVGTTGVLRVYDTSAPDRAVATVDFSQMTGTDTIGGQTFNVGRRVHVDGNDVVVYLPSHALTYGKTYSVSLDAGAIRGPGNAAFSITDRNDWTFQTAAAAPANASLLRVALDGTGHFCSPQGALDLVPENNTSRLTIEIGAGTYRGIVLFSNKRNVTLRGADRKRVVLAGVNNNSLNAGTRARALVGADNANGLVLENLTIHNQTPQGGSQAEALRLQSCDQCVVRDADLLSLQDTLLWSGRIYAQNCYVEGNVDFVWGEGIAYFEDCEIKTVGRSGPIVQARNAAGANGYVFVDSRITSDSGLSGGVLARIDAGVYPGSAVAFVDCVLGSHIERGGWTITGGGAPATLRFWEYRSRDAGGALIDTSGRVAGSRQIDAQQAAALRDKAAVFGGWTPPP